jgi:alpha-L-fucosidase 2
MKRIKTTSIAAILLLLWLHYLAVDVYAQTAKPTNDLKIWYTEPAALWLEALPLGNGRIGGMVLGGVSEERIILNESSLYSRESSIPETLPDMSRHLDILSRMIKNGDYADADEYSTKHVTGSAVPCYQPLGDIVFQFQGQEDSYTGYTRELNLANAVATVNYNSGGTLFTREVFLSNPDDILIIRLKSSQKGKLNFDVSMESVHPTAHLSVEDKELVFTGQVPGVALRRTFEWVEEWGQQWKYPEIWDKEGNRRTDVSFFSPPDNTENYPIVYNGKGIKFESRIRILRCDGRISDAGNKLRVNGAQEVVLAVSVSSGFNGFDKDPVTEGADPEALNKAILSKVANKSYNQLLHNHISDYQWMFNRVSLQVPSLQNKVKQTTQQRKTEYSLSSDPSFAALYFQYGRYLLISCSRKGGQPANLQGLWNVDIIPPWGSAYTTNINMQMNYWAAESANLAECHEPLFRFLREVSITGSRVAQEMYKRPGWVLHHNSSLWRGAHPVDWYGSVSFWPMGGGWLCRHLWQHYAYTKDLLFLKETAYPIMKGAAQFYNSWLADNGSGQWVTPVSTSPENAFIYMDENGIRKSAGMNMASTLDLAVIRELFENTIEAQKLLQTDIDFSLVLENKLEKLYPYQIGKRGQFLEFYKEFIDSPPRHNTSPYYPLYPGNQFTFEKNVEYTQAVKKLILDRTGSRPGGGGWVGTWYAALWARLGESERTLPYIEAALRRTHQNLFSGGGSVFQIDANLGYTAAITEMLLQSHSGEIKLLPALPDVWPSGKISGLCAEGGCEVDITWKDKQLTEVTVRSKSTDRIKVRYADKTTELDMKSGQTIRLDSGLKRK